MARTPVVLLHGYSDVGVSFAAWEQVLRRRGYEANEIHIGNYETLTNEVSIQDIAEGLERALRIQADLKNGEPFDAIVHSTGMLVIRAWLAVYGYRQARLKHLVALAPASFGSPLAHKGRSWLGTVLKGNRELGPDFMEAGDRVLDALELGSRFTWDLAHRDLLPRRPDDPPIYGPGGETPYVFVFCGTDGYEGIRGLANQMGTDGTVRLAGCSLNTRKIVLDLTKKEVFGSPGGRLAVWEWSREKVHIPLIPITGRNHATILSEPKPELIEMVDEALNVAAASDHAEWLEKYDVLSKGSEAMRETAKRTKGRWQQFVVRAIDERGDPVTDYNLQLFGSEGAGAAGTQLPFDIDVHAYSGDASLRCFHLDLDQGGGLEKMDRLWMEITVSSGSELVGYYGIPDGITLSEDGASHSGFHRGGWWEGAIDLSQLAKDGAVKLAAPFTTTLVELRLNREPMPLDPHLANRVLSWVARD